MREPGDDGAGALRMDDGELTEAEDLMWAAFARGEAVDLSARSDRLIRARVLRSLLLRAPREDGEIPALRLRGARITGELNLRSGDVDVRVALRDCGFEEPPVLHGAVFRLLTLAGSRLPGLRAAALRVEGSLHLEDCRITGRVQLGGAQIDGALFLDRAVLGTPRAPAGDALELDHASVGQDLSAVGLSVHGRTRFDGLAVRGRLLLDDAVLLHPGDSALDAETLSVGSDLHAMRLRTEGRVDLRGASVAGQLNLARAHLSNPAGLALRASSCTASELWLREATVEGGVNLRRARFDLLHADVSALPGEVRLDGLTYTTLAPPLPAQQRLATFRRDADGYVPFAYEQLTAAYRHIGDDAGARRVQLAKQRRQRETLPVHGRLWGYVQDLTVGYGFRPLRAAGWLGGLLLLGSLVFSGHPPYPLNAQEAPQFNAFAYTLDLLLPIIDFGQERAYDPRGGHQWIAYALILAGWILATTFVAGVNRAVSRP